MEKLKPKDLKGNELFMVNRLQTAVEVDIFGQKQEIKLKDVYGFFPIFDSYEKASNFSQNGKYQIIVLEEI